MTRIIAIVGLCGSGKSEAASVLLAKGFSYLRFGQLTIDELARRGLEANEQNERSVREELRETHGRAAYATLNIPKIEELLKKGSIIIDGLYSWEEYTALKEQFGEQLLVMAIYARPELRYERLAKRPERPLSREEAMKRDIAEIENISKAGPIAMADVTVLNNGTLDELKENISLVCEEVL